MLKTRIATAVVLLAVLLPILYSGNFFAFSIVAILFFGLALWESLRLFKNPAPVVAALAWTALFAYIILSGAAISFAFLFLLCAAFWLLRLIPALKLGLPAFNGASNAFLSGVYSASIFGCFVAIAVLFRHSPIFLLSVMAVVWVADIGAYFAGKAFGRNKLAPSISPGKSWEGAIGGWIAVLVISSLVATVATLPDTFPARILVKGGWPGLIAVMTVLSAASVVGDLFESLLKRRATMKDSSSLLPGHGGVLDRIDALIPVLPVAALLDYWW